MHPSKPQQSIINELNSHASLLLSASPTIINSPLQNNTNNTSATTNSNNNTNNTSSNNANLTVNFSDDEMPEDNINFKKPQNEIFRKLDGKIQKIVAAHSNLNKLYALNDFPSSVPSTRKPFELPPQLPRPPPWIPKVSSDYGCSQWVETLNNIDRTVPPEFDDDLHRTSTIPGPHRVTRIVSKVEPRSNVSSPVKLPAPSIDSAISKLHLRRHQQQQQEQQQHQKVQLPPVRPQQIMQHKFQVPQAQPRISEQAQKIHQLNIKPVQNTNQGAVRELFPGSSRPNTTVTQISSKDLGALNALIRAQKQQQQQIQQQNQQQQHQQQQLPPRESTGPTSIPPNLTAEERRKFQVELINIFRQEIAAVTKLAKLKFQSPQSNDRPSISDQKSLLLKKSPQSLFNTIRRETSLLLNRREPVNNKAGISLLSEQQPTANRSNFSHDVKTTLRPTFNRHQTIKVVVPPTEHFKHTCGKQPGTKESSENLECHCFETKAQYFDLDEWCPSRQFTLKYRNLQMKLYQLKYTQKKDELNRKRGISISMLPADARKRLVNPQKSLDKIVDRLQAKCMTPTSSSPVYQGSQNQSPIQSGKNSPASDSPKSCQKQDIALSPPSSPKPIPVFRTSPNKDGLAPGGPFSSTGNSRAVSLKSKKAKRLHHYGLRLGNYMEKECPQPTTEKITVEQFAKCLNLVRSNDVSLRRHQEKLMQSEMNWKAPISDRPLRLRRIRGERMHMPASASYKATRRVGLQ